MRIPIQTLAERYAEAVKSMEIKWKLLQADKWNERLLLRYVRSLRKCLRLRNIIKTMTETGTL